MTAMINPLGQQSGFNSPMGQPPTLNQTLGQQSSFNPSMGQPPILNQTLGQPSGFNPLIGQSQPHTLSQPLQQSEFNSSIGPSNILNKPLGQTCNFNNPLIQPNTYNSSQISNFNQPKSFGQLPNLNQQLTFQPIQSHSNNFSHAFPSSPSFNQPSSVYNQRAPSGKLIYIFRYK